MYYWKFFDLEAVMNSKRLGFIYNHIEEIVLVILFAFMVGVIFLQVIMRYSFNNSLSWSEEVGRFIFEWLTWIGMSLGAREGQHIKITLLVDKLPSKAANTANILSEIIVIAICILTMFYGVELSKMFLGSKFTSIKISLAWGYASVIVGCGLMAIRSLVSIKRSAMSLLKGSPVESNEGGVA